jgi:hypothetical protein
LIRLSGGIAIAALAVGPFMQFKGAAAIERQSTVIDWTRVIQAEYREMPGLRLTKPQVRRLWGLDPQTCDRVLDVLVTSAVLKKTPRQTYALVQGEAVAH